MTPIEFANIVKRIEIKGFGIPIKLSTEQQPGKLVFGIELHVSDRESGRMAWISNVSTFNLIELDIMDEKHVMFRIHRFIRDMILHELDECFYYKGKRIFDPHSKEEVTT